MIHRPLIRKFDLAGSGFTPVIIGLIFLIMPIHSYAQLKHERNTKKNCRDVSTDKEDTNRVRVLLRWGTVLLDRQAVKRTDFDSAYLLAGEAYRLSEALKFEKGKEESVFLKGNYYLLTHRMHSFDSLMNVVTPSLHVKLLLKSIAVRSTSEGDVILGSVSIINELQSAMQLMLKEKETILVVRCKLGIGEGLFIKGRMEEGAKFFVDALHYARENNSKKGEEMVLTTSNYFLFTKNGKELIDELFIYERELTAEYPTLVKEDDIRDVQISLSRIASTLNMYYMHLGKTNEALDVALRAIRVFEANNGTLEVAELPDHVGRIFFRTEKFDLALKYGLMAFSIYNRNNEKIDTDIFKFIIRAYVALGKPKEGLEFLKNNVRIEDYTMFYKVPILSSFGDCYFAMGDNTKAEKFYLESHQLSKSLSTFNEAVTCYPLGKLYVRTKQYHKAKFYLERATTLVGIHMVPVWVQRDIQHLLFKTDSATGDYLSAIDHLNRYRVLNDSIFNLNRNRQIEELKIQFENDKKDTEIKSKEQNIELLTKQSQLQQADLQQTRILRNSFVAGVIVLFILLALTYNRYRLKQRTNKLLRDKQDKINLANCNLRDANHQLQRLLGEKEWLVKEIHHRVKNNLQIVVSLLNTQANHLVESEALTAIRESQQRMQVISLLHQRLYRMEESRLVDMKTYIRELTGYISEGYKTARHIYLVIEVQDVYLDISQAVSVGLIINEAITNSYKYAFTETQNGLIRIALETTEQNNLILRVSDNGKGLPSEFHLSTSTSMGLRLIQTLADQLDGQLTIENRDGVIISVQFKPIHHELKSPSDELEIMDITNPEL